VLKCGSQEDPPDAYEIARNDFLDSIQGNRNPFIDSMHYACFIDFYTMTKIPNVIAPCGSFVGVNSIKNTFIDFSVFPNPSSGSFSYLVNTENGNYELNISDLSGRSIYKKQIETKSGKLYGTVSDVILNSGIYFIEISSDKGKWVKKLVIQE
jgi:hypothetical protein